jgi:hypothetical protein
VYYSYSITELHQHPLLPLPRMSLHHINPFPALPSCFTFSFLLIFPIQQYNSHTPQYTLLLNFTPPLNALPYLSFFIPSHNIHTSLLLPIFSYCLCLCPATFPSSTSLHITLLILYPLLSHPSYLPNQNPLYCPLPLPHSILSSPTTTNKTPLTFPYLSPTPPIIHTCLSLFSQYFIWMLY